MEEKGFEKACPRVGEGVISKDAVLEVDFPGEKGGGVGTWDRVFAIWEVPVGEVGVAKVEGCGGGEGGEEGSKESGEDGACEGVEEPGGEEEGMEVTGIGEIGYDLDEEFVWEVGDGHCDGEGRYG